MTTAVLSPALRPPMRLLRIAALVIGGALLGLAFGALLVAIIATRVFDYELLTVRSGSMEPAISRGDLIIVKPAAMRDLAEGDIVLFEAGGDGIPTVHRVAGINEVELRIFDPASGAVASSTDYRLVTKGDANEAEDLQEVTRDEFIGQVWFSVPGGGAFTGLPLQYILLGIAGASVVAWAAWEIRQRSGRQQ